MKRKNMFHAWLIMMVLVGVLIGSNAHAFIITTQLNAFNIQLIPADSNTTMSLEWTHHDGVIDMVAHDNESSDGYLEFPNKPISRTFVAQAANGQIEFEVDEYNASAKAELSESPSEPIRCSELFSITSHFTVQGEGQVLISAVHSVEYEKDSSIGLEYHTEASIYLKNDTLDSPSGAFDESIFFHLSSELSDQSSELSDQSLELSDQSLELSDDLEVGLFFEDGDTGSFRLNFESRFNNQGDPPPVPIPATVWLLGWGLGGLAIIRKGKQSSLER